MVNRLERLRNCMQDAGWSAVLITDPANVFYFSGFTGCRGDANLFITQSTLHILTDARYTLQVKEQCPHYTVLGTSASDLTALGAFLHPTNSMRVGFENETISYDLWHRLTSKYPDIVFVPVHQHITSLRSVKDAQECILIEQACQCAVNALKETVPYIHVGVSEQDLAAELEYRMRLQGASGPSFETIVASGPRSALPHGAASARHIEYGDCVTIDFGAVYQGYCSDMTRTFFVGDGSELLREIYHTVLQAQQAAMDQFYVGMPANELDGIARQVIIDAGYGKYFTHSLGHGVGIDIHEALSVGKRETKPIVPGMVFSIEPGIYIEGVGGVRIEDLVVCEETGLRVLTAGFEKALAIL